MGKCKYCGGSTILFFTTHKECEGKHQQGLNDFSSVLNDYFTQRVSLAEVNKKKRYLSTDTFLSEDDICTLSDLAIRHYTASIHCPFSPKSMHLMDEYLNVVGVPYNKINAKGAVDEFAKKLLRGFMVEYFTDKLDLQTAHTRCKKVLAKFPMDQGNIEDAYLYVLNKAIINFQKDGVMTNNEQQKINDYVNYLSLPVNNLPVTYQNSEISKMVQMSIIKNLQNGIVPSSTYTAPIVLSKGESVIWIYNDVTMYQEKVEKEYGGRRSGWSFRIMKGVTYHIGGTKIKPIEHSYMDNKGVGTLFITNKHIIFQGTTAAQRIPYSKMIGVTPYSDGIEVHQDRLNAKRLFFQGFDSWFLTNILPYMV